jgi:hypothetical protein
MAIRISNAPMSGCIDQAISGSIPCEAKKGNHPDFVIKPQVPCPIKHKAAVILNVQ